MKTFFSGSQTSVSGRYLAVRLYEPIEAIFQQRPQNTTSECLTTDWGPEGTYMSGVLNVTFSCLDQGVLLQSVLTQCTYRGGWW